MEVDGASVDVAVELAFKQTVLKPLICGRVLLDANLHDPVCTRKPTQLGFMLQEFSQSFWDPFTSMMNVLPANSAFDTQL
jgi:hypothetical protein